MSPVQVTFIFSNKIGNLSALFHSFWILFSLYLDLFTGDGRPGTVSFEDGEADDNEVKKRRGPAQGEVIGASVETLRQYYMMVTCKWRLAALLSFIRLHKKEKVIVFFSTCDSVDYHAMLLRETRWPTQLDDEVPGAGDEDYGKGRGVAAIRQQLRHQMGQGEENESLEPLGSEPLPLFGDEKIPLFRLHGNVVQKDRQSIYKEFSNSTTGVMFCTDVAARGLDMPNVDWIVQVFIFCPPPPPLRFVIFAELILCSNVLRYSTTLLVKPLTMFTAWVAQRERV